MDATWGRIIARKEDRVDGQLRGPWQAQHVVYFLDPNTMNRYTFPTGTVGGAIAVRELVDKTNWMRRFRGPHVYPVVTLSDTYMNTKWGGRQRPHFLIKRWVSFGPGENALPAPVEAPTPVTHRLAQFAPPKAEETPVAPVAPTQSGPPMVAEPTPREVLDDEIPFSRGGESESGRQALSPPVTVRRKGKRRTSSKSTILDAG